VGAWRGFSLDATVRWPATVRGWKARGKDGAVWRAEDATLAASTRARPIFASERLLWATSGKRLVYHLALAPSRRPNVLSLTTMEFLERLARLMPPPRRHRHRYHGVLAPNAPLRSLVTARAGLPFSRSLSHSYAPGNNPFLPQNETAHTSASIARVRHIVARQYVAFPSPRA
jgi:Putative transposase